MMVPYGGMGIRSALSGGWADLAGMEDRALSAPAEPSPWLTPSTATAPLNVTTSNALRVSDAYACVRVLADSISSAAAARLPPHRPRAACRPATTPRSVQLLDAAGARARPAST